MSRTYRYTEDWIHHGKGKFWTDDEYDREWDRQQEEFKPCYNWKIPCRGWNLTCTRHKKGRDHKMWNKPPHWFKQEARRRERARVKNAMDRGLYDSIPIFKNTDQWNWT